MPWKTCMWRGKAQVEISAISAVVLAAVLASRGILQGGLAVFVLSLSPFPSHSCLCHSQARLGKETSRETKAFSCVCLLIFYLKNIDFLNSIFPPCSGDMLRAM